VRHVGCIGCLHTIAPFNTQNAYGDLLLLVKEYQRVNYTFDCLFEKGMVLGKI
jgi:hypothetical protein